MSTTLLSDRYDTRRVSEYALDTLFREARTYNGWLDKPVSESLLREAYDLAKMGPTSANLAPARFLFFDHTRGEGAVDTGAFPGQRR